MDRLPGSARQELGTCFLLEAYPEKVPRKRPNREKTEKKRKPQNIDFSCILEDAKWNLTIARTKLVLS